MKTPMAGKMPGVMEKLSATFSQFLTPARSSPATAI
jgi:hypothetical protein